VAGSFEHGDKTSGSTKVDKYLDKLSNSLSRKMLSRVVGETKPTWKNSHLSNAFGSWLSQFLYSGYEESSKHALMILYGFINIPGEVDVTQT
jgi:hypothetical protein